MLFYKLSETAVVEESLIGQYAPLFKIPNAERFFNYSNCELTIVSLGWKMIEDLKIRIYSSNSPSTNISVYCLNKSDIKIFTRIEDKYLVFYVRGDYAGEKIIVKYESGINANFITPIWGGKFITSQQQSDFEVDTLINPDNISTDILNDNYLRIAKIERLKLIANDSFHLPFSLSLCTSGYAGGRIDADFCINVNRYSQSSYNIAAIYDLNLANMPTFYITESSGICYLYMKCNSAKCFFFNLCSLLKIPSDKYKVTYLFDQVTEIVSPIYEKTLTTN